MESERLIISQTDITSNPAPLGLMGFGMTTVLLNLHNAGFFGLGSMILAMGIFYGGLAQVIAGIMEWKKGNTFGTTAFTSYGFFWLTLVALIVMPKMGLIEAPDNSAMIAYLLKFRHTPLPAALNYPCWRGTTNVKNTIRNRQTRCRILQHCKR